MLYFIYSKTSISEHLYIVNTSNLNTCFGPPKRMLLWMNLYIVNTSLLWTLNTFFGPITRENLCIVNILAIKCALSAELKERETKNNAHIERSYENECSSMQHERICPRANNQILRSDKILHLLLYGLVRSDDNSYENSSSLTSYIKSYCKTLDRSCSHTRYYCKNIKKIMAGYDHPRIL